jgi:hypothetical protein
VDHQRDYGKDQQKVDQETCDVEKDETADPKNPQKNGNKQKRTEPHNSS